MEKAQKDPERTREVEKVNEKNHEIMAGIIKLHGLPCPHCEGKDTLGMLKYLEPRTRSVLLMLFCTRCGYPFVGGD